MKFDGNAGRRLNYSSDHYYFLVFFLFLPFAVLFICWATRNQVCNIYDSKDRLFLSFTFDWFFLYI